MRDVHLRPVPKQSNNSGVTALIGEDEASHLSLAVLLAEGRRRCGLALGGIYGTRLSPAPFPRLQSRRWSPKQPFVLMPLCPPCCHSPNPQHTPPHPCPLGRQFLISLTLFLACSSVICIGLVLVFYASTASNNAQPSPPMAMPQPLPLHHGAAVAHLTLAKVRLSSSNLLALSTRHALAPNTTSSDTQPHRSIIAAWTPLRSNHSSLVGFL